MNAQKLLDEIKSLGLGYEDLEDGTFLVHYDTSIDDFSIIGGLGNCIIRADDDTYYIDLQFGAGESEYPKSDYTLEEAIKDCVSDEY